MTTQLFTEQFPPTLVHRAKHALAYISYFFSFFSVKEFIGKLLHQEENKDILDLIDNKKIKIIMLWGCEKW